MATAKRSTIRRYNGTDWDTIYLSTVADIIGLGQQIQVSDITEAPYKNGDTIDAHEIVYNVLKKIIGRLQYIDTTVIGGITSGDSVTSLEANKITGKLNNDQLPDDVHGNFYDNVDNDKKDDYTDYAPDLKVGDIVRTNEGYLYGVKAMTPEALEGDGESKTTITWLKLFDDTDVESLSWSVLTDIPEEVTHNLDDVEGETGDGEEKKLKLYLTNVVLFEDILTSKDDIEDSDTEGEGDSEGKSKYANKAVGLNDDGMLDFEVTKIDLDNEKTVISGRLGRENLPSNIGGEVYGPYEDLDAAIEELKDDESFTSGDHIRLENGALYMYQPTTRSEESGNEAGEGETKSEAEIKSNYKTLVNPADFTIDWSQLDSVPTEITRTKPEESEEESGEDDDSPAKLYISNALLTSDWTDSAIDETKNNDKGEGDTSKANMLVKVGADGKLKADVTHLGGQPAAFYGITEVDAVESLENMVLGQIVLIPWTVPSTSDDPTDQENSNGGDDNGDTGSPTDGPDETPDDQTGGTGSSGGGDEDDDDDGHGTDFGENPDFGTTTPGGTNFGPNPPFA